MSLRKYLLAVAACAAAPALAQESLLDVYRRALEFEPAMREAEAVYLAAAEAKPQARASLLPSVTLGAARAHRFQDTLGGAIDPITGVQVGTRFMFEQDSAGWSVSLAQTVFDWAAYARLRQADKRVVGAETDYRAAQQSLLIRVATAYFDVLAAEDRVASASAAREAIARQLEQARRRFDVGLIGITDAEQARAGYDDVTATEIEAQHASSIAREALRKLAGVHVVELASPMEQLPLLTPDPANAEEWVRAALSSNLTLISSRIAADVAEDDVAIQRASRLPTLTLSGSYNDDDQDRLQTLFRPLPQTTPSTQLPQGRSWSLDLRFPLLTGGLNRSRVRQSVHQHRAASEALESVALDTELHAREAYLGVLSAIERVRALRQAVESNRTALRASEGGFRVGTQSTVDVLASQNGLRRAETAYSRSRYDYILNLLRLKEAAGTLAVGDLEQVDAWLE
jgi:outer membrane protein